MSWGSPREVRVESSIAASPDAIWDLLADHEGMPDWMPLREVVRRRPGTPEPDGIGAVRTLKTGGFVFDEEIVAWKPGERLEYRLLGGAPLRDHRAVVALSAIAGGTRIVWTVCFRPAIPGTGFLIERQVRRLLEAGVSGLARELSGARA